MTRPWFKPALTEAEQLFMRGARDYAAGVLRKETGAAIKDDELTDVFRRYIDMGLDPQAVRAAKAKARAEVEQTFRRMTSRASQFYDQMGGGTQPPNEPPANDPDAEWLAQYRKRRGGG
jgi:hypothetical protein